MKKLIAVLFCIFALNAHAAPSDADIQAYKARAALYVSLKQTPSQVVVSLRNYFGKPYFFLNSNGWVQTTDIQYVEGSGTEIMFLETLGTLPE